MQRDIVLFVHPAADRGRGGRAAGPAAQVLKDIGVRIRQVIGTSAADALTGSLSYRCGMIGL